MKIHQRIMARYVLGFIVGLWAAVVLSFCTAVHAQEVVARGNTPDGSEYVLMRSQGPCKDGMARAYKRERDGTYHWGCYYAETQYVVILHDNGRASYVVGRVFKVDQFYEDELRRQQRKGNGGVM